MQQIKIFGKRLENQHFAREAPWSSGRVQGSRFESQRFETLKGSQILFHTMFMFHQLVQSVKKH